METIIRKSWRFVRCDKDNFYEERYLERRGVPPSFISEIIAVKRKKKRFTMFSFSSSLSLFFFFPKSVCESRPKTRPEHLYRTESRRAVARKKLSGKRATTFRAPLAISQLHGAMHVPYRSLHDRPRSLYKRIRARTQFSLPNRPIRDDPERRQYTPCVTRSTFRKTDKLLNVFCEVDILDFVMYLITFSRKYTSLYLNSMTEKTRQ